MNKLLSVSLSFLIASFSFVAIAYANALTDNELLLGFYTVSKKQNINKQDIDMISGSPFKYLLPYGTDLRDEAFLDEYLNYAKKKGIYIIFSMLSSYRESKSYPKTHWCPSVKESELVSCIVNRFKDYNSVYGWYITDEPTDKIGLQSKEKIKAVAEAIKKLSSKPIFSEDYPIPKGKLWDYMSKFSDGFMATSYPIPDRSLSDTYDVIKKMSSKYNNNIIAVLQAFGKYQFPRKKRDEITGRAPTYEEMRVMSYLALMAGAKGIFYFSLPKIKKLPDFKDRWSLLKKLGSELKSNYKLIVSQDKPIVNYRLKVEDGVYYLVRHFKNKDYLIAVNSTGEPRSLEIFLKERIMKTITLGSLEVKILELQP